MFGSFITWAVRIHHKHSEYKKASGKHSDGVQGMIDDVGVEIVIRNDWDLATGMEFVDYVISGGSLRQTNYIVVTGFRGLYTQKV